MRTWVKRRIRIDAWGITGPRAEAIKASLNGYADLQFGELRLEAVRRSIARRTGLHWVSIREDGCPVEGGRITATHYCGTLGRPVASGGWEPVTQIWFSIPLLTKTKTKEKP